MDERPDLGRAPAWARHLHDCIHRMEAQQTVILERLGKESDDGKSGTGLVGEVRRTSAHVASLTAERNMVRGAMAAITAAGMLLLLGVKAWVLQLVGHGQS